MKTLKFEFNGCEYNLAFTRESVKTMEQEGFDATKMESMPFTMLPKLFYGAFHVYHKGISRKKVDEIWDAFGEDKTSVVEALTELYVDTLNSLISGESTKKIQWEIR